MRATKLLKEVKHLSYVERLKYLNLPTLQYRRFRGDMIMVYKVLVYKRSPAGCSKWKQVIKACN